MFLKLLNTFLTLYLTKSQNYGVIDQHVCTVLIENLKWAPEEEEKLKIIKNILSVIIIYVFKPSENIFNVTLTSSNLW